MNSMLTINVRVVGRAAQAQLNQLAAATSAVVGAGATGKAKQTLGFFDALRSNKLLNAGKNLQWVGRQLMFNFTLPLVAAGAALTKFNLDVQRSMTEVKKVYGDMTFTQERVKEETDALAKSFSLLSTRFGVHQKEVVDIAAAWASAGSAGRGLAENVQGTLEAMVLGEMDAAKATEGLIAIQATWGLSTKRNSQGVSDLSKALATMNIIENQTGIRFEGLIDVLTRAGGVARTAGMTIQELAAMAAALVPATGSAVQAGNALKTIISRIQAPTKETIDILGKMGITVASEEWLGKTATEKIIDMATAFDGLSQANKTLVSSIIASRWQVNKFSVLMADVASGTGYFAKAMNASAKELQNNTQYQKELNTVLDSNPKKWDIMTNAIRNSMADALVPLIPIILQILGMFTRLARWFAALPQSARTMIIMGLALLALAGPVVTLGAMFIQLGGLIQLISKGIALAMMKLIIPALERTIIAFGQFVVSWVSGWIAVHAATLGWIVLIVAAIAGIILAFTVWHDQTMEVLQGIANGFGQLPGIIGRALLGVLQVVAKIVQAIWNWLSYLNPFARHSPSLVDQVRAGVSTILDEYARLARLPNIIAGALRAIDSFAAANKKLLDAFRSSELNELREGVVKGGGNAASADAMIASIRELEAVLPGLSAEIDHQASVVAEWQAQLEAADRVLAEAEGRLTAAEAAFGAVSDQIEAARDRMNDLVNTPIQGMRAMEDQIFANEMAQNKLNLALLEYEKAGVSLDSIKDKFQAINGEVELLRGEQQGLRMAGAGSDVLKTYEDQIDAIEDQRQELGETERAITDINKQLDELDLERRFLDLTKSINFDPLVRQIDQMVNSVGEMSFDDIVAGIREQQALIAQLQPQYDEMAAAVERETAAVDAAKLARDGIAAQLDAEQTRLDALKNAYSEIEGLIRDMEDSMRKFAEQAEKAASAVAKKKKGGGAGAGGAGDLFDAGAGADFPIAGGGDVLGPEGILADIEAFNKELEDKLKEVFGGMTIDFTKPFKEAWEKLKTWVLGLPWKEIGLVIAAGIGVVLLGALVGIPALLALAIGAALAGLAFVFIKYGPQIWDWTYQHVVEPIKNALDSAIEFVQRWAGILFDPLKDAFKTVTEFFRDVISGAKTFGTNVGKVTTAAFSGIKLAFDKFSSGLRIAWDFLWKYLMDPIVAFIGWVNTFIVPLITSTLELILAIIERVVSIISFIVMGALGIIMTIASQLGNAIEVVLNVLQEPFDIFMAALQLLGTLIWEALQIIIAIYQNFFDNIRAMWDFISSLVLGIAGDLMTGLINIFTRAFDIIRGLLETIFKTFETIFNQIRIAVETALTLITGIIKVATDIIKGDWGKAWNHIKDTITGVWNGIKEFVNTTIDGIKGTLKGIWDSIKGAAALGWQGIKDVILNPLGEVLEFITDLPAKLIKLVIKFVEAGSKLGGALLDGIKAGVKAVGGFAADVGRALANALIDAWNWVADRINSFIPDQLGWGMFSLDIPDNPIDHIDRLHSGGVVSGPKGQEQLAILQAGEIVFQPEQLKAFAQSAALLGASRTSPVGAVPSMHKSFIQPDQVPSFIRYSALLAAFTSRTIDLDKLPNPPMRFHNGGVVPGAPGSERLAMLQAGEIVFSPSQFAKLDKGSGTTININGDLSFPNITNPEDAHEFIQNLKAMVE